jgi:hypothetical protein
VESKIWPLSLHQPIPLDAPEKNGAVPYCEVRMQGSFGMGQMHAWVSTCFPAVPSKVPDSDTAKYNFESCYSGTRSGAQLHEACQLPAHALGGRTSARSPW